MATQDSKIAMTPVNVTVKPKRHRKKKGKRTTPGVAPQRRQETKTEAALADVVNNVRTGKPPSNIPYTDMNKAQKFALGMVDPIHYPTRVPDADSNMSAMYRSYEVFEIPVRVGADLSDSGAFAIAIQPKIGDTIDPTAYKVAVADPLLISDDPQATDWSAGSSYLKKLGSLDPRMVNEIDTLALNEAGFFQLQGTTGMSTALPLGTAPAENAGNGFIEVDYNASNGDIILPVGQFQVTGAIISSGGNVSSFALIPGVVGDAPQINNLTSLSGSGSTSAQQSWIVTTTPGATHIKLTTALTAGVVNATSLTVVPTAKTDIPQALTNGMVEKVRVSGCCYWLTYTGTTLKDGGKVSTAVVNGDALTSRFFSEGAGGNNGNFRSFAGIGMVPGAMTDRLKTGCYGYIVPNNVLDLAYYPVDQHNSYKYNSAVIYGKFEPDDNPAGPVISSPIRLIVCTVYEYTTTSQIPELAINKGSDSQVAAALNFLAEMPRVMTNDSHQGFWNKVKSALSKVTHGIKGALDRGSEFMKTIQTYEPAARQMIETLMPMFAV